MSSRTNAEPLGELIPTRKTLLSRIKNAADDESWRTFFNAYWKLIYTTGLKSGLSDAEAQDVVQETIIAVARNIGRLHYDPAVCSFKSWLLKVTRSRILNQLRSKERRRELPAPGNDGTSGTPWLERLPDPAGAALDRLWDEEWAKNLMDAALERVKQRAPVEQYQMFDLYVLREWPVKKVARTLGVSVGRVYLAKHRISKMIRREVMALESHAL